MQHPSMARRNGPFRAVNDKCLENEDISSVPSSDKDICGPDKAGYFSDRNTAMAVRSEGNLQRAIVGRAVINKQSQRDHASDDGNRRLNMDNASLDTPRPKSLNIRPGLYSNRSILVPRYAPV